MITRIKNISIIGDGSWGTTLGIYLAHKNYPVTIWGAFPENIRHIKKTGFNDKFLPGIKIPQGMNATDKLGLAIDSADLIVLAIPSQYLDKTLKKIRKFDLSNKIILSVIKGIDTISLLRMSEIITKNLGHVQLAVLSGPTIAMEVARSIPTTAVISAKNLKVAKILQKVFNSHSFRVYTNRDMAGIEIGGSLKNIIAIACGVCDGLGFGTNAKAAILTRGLVEMARLGKAMGAKSKTFAGLTGLGDLVTTCVSHQSRNRYVGEQLGKGRKLKEIVSSMDMVAEGVATVKAAFKLSQKFKISMPITTEVYNIIYKGKGPHKAVADLMNRKLKAE